MTFSVFFVVLFAAFLHVCWNTLIKIGTSKLTSMLILTMTQGAIGGAIAATRTMPEGQVWWWLIGSGILHASYKFFLAFAYEHGDLSRVYPIARGAAPLIVLAVGWLLLSDQINVLEFAGIVVLGIGILLMANGVFASGESRRLVPLALGSAFATAGYSLVDGLADCVPQSSVDASHGLNGDTAVAQLVPRHFVHRLPVAFDIERVLPEKGRGDLSFDDCQNFGLLDVSVCVVRLSDNAC